MGTNPAREHHEQKVRQALGLSLPGDNVLSRVGEWAFGGVARAAMGIDYHNFLLFSATTMGDNISSFGILGHVFVNPLGGNEQH